MSLIENDSKFTIIHNDAKYISNIFDAIANIIDNGTLEINSDGLYISGMDESHTSFIDLVLDKDDLSEFSFNSVKSIKLGIILKEFVKILKVGDKNDKLLLENINNETLIISFISDGITRKYSMKLINNDFPKIQVPDMDYQMELDISSKLFTKIINSITILDSEHIEFAVKNSKLTLKSPGDYSDIDLTFNKSENEIIKKKIKLSKNMDNNKIVEKSEFSYKLYKSYGDFTSSFGLNIIKKISKINNIADNILCSLSPDFPIKFEYHLNKETNSIITFHITPKII